MGGFGGVGGLEKDSYYFSRKFFSGHELNTKRELQTLSVFSLYACVCLFASSFRCASLFVLFAFILFGPLFDFFRVLFLYLSISLSLFTHISLLPILFLLCLFLSGFLKHIEVFYLGSSNIC